MAKKTAKKAAKPAAKKAAPKGAGKRDATLTNVRALEKRVTAKLLELEARVFRLENL